MNRTVFIPEPIAEAGMALLRGTCDCIAPWAHDAQASSPREIDIPENAEAVIVRLFAVTAQHFKAASRLRVIAKHGVGVDNIDVPEATRRRIPVVFTPTSNANAVAEHAITLMLALARQLEPAVNAIRAGRFHERTQIAGVELAGKTLAVLGLGRIGRRVAEIASRGFAMRVVGYDPFIEKDQLGDSVRLEPSLEAALAAADFVTLHLPLTKDTRQLINADRLLTVKPTCRIVNTSRGEVIDDQALVQALVRGRIAGAALDVFEQEPLPADHPFFATPNLLLTPHISSSTRESLDRMAIDAAQGVLDVFDGKRPHCVVNPEVFA